MQYNVTHEGKGYSFVLSKTQRTSWKQPALTSNTSYGELPDTYLAGANAYRLFDGDETTGVTVSPPRQGGAVEWNLPEKIKITGISILAGTPGGVSIYTSTASTTQIGSTASLVANTYMDIPGISEDGIETSTLYFIFNPSVSGTEVKNIKITAYKETSHVLTSYDTPNNFYCFAPYVTEKTYTITFKNYNGVVLSTQTVQESRMPNIPAVPERTDGYVFIGWDSEVHIATSNKTYTAKFVKLDAYEQVLVSGANEIEVPIGVKIIKVEAYAKGIDYGGDIYWAKSIVSHDDKVWANAYTGDDTERTSTAYVGVTGGKIYTLIAEMSSQLGGAMSSKISWSVDINKETPTVTDY